MYHLSRTSLKHRVLNASTWTVAGFGCNQMLRFGSNLLLTRLLVPKMFGVMAVAMLVVIGLGMFSDLGLKPSVVHSRRGNDPVFLNTAWVTQILRGMLLWLFALIASLLIYYANRIGIVPKGTVYADPILPFVVAILSVIAVTSGFESTKLLQASRNLLLKRVAQIEIISQIAAILCMIGWAFIDRSIWALVAGAISSAVVRVILSHTWVPGVPNRWQWDKLAFREIFHFGKWMFLSSILGFLVNSGDRLLLGGLLNSNSLGIYSIAYLIFNSLEQVPMKIMGDVSFPALSEVSRDRPTEFKRSYYRFHVVIASFVYICSGVLITSGASLVHLLYDPRYEQAGWMLEILAVALLTVPFRLATQSFLAFGLPHLLSTVIAIRLVTLFVATPIGFYFLGILGALWGIVLSHFSYLPTIILYNVRHKIFDLRTEVYLLPIVPVGMAVGRLVAVMIGD
ncbi:MAG: oligosaccharide flippase family protein [Steroidobacteraceae bacterium]